MNFAFFLVAALFALTLILLLLWALRGASNRKGVKDGLAVLDEATQHVGNMLQMRQALDEADLQFAAAKGGPELAARLRRERRQVVLLYLQAIRKDFEKLLRIARVIALLSPEISGSQEYQRLRLSILFRLRFEYVKFRLRMGRFVFPQTDALGQMVGSLAAQIEMAVANLGERAALAAELAVQSDQ